MYIERVYLYKYICIDVFVSLRRLLNSALQWGAQTACSWRAVSGLPTSVVKVPIRVYFTRSITKSHHSAMLVLSPRKGEVHRQSPGEAAPLHSSPLQDAKRQNVAMATAKGWGLPPRKCREIPLPSGAYTTDGGSMGHPGLLSASSKCAPTHTWAQPIGLQLTGLLNTKTTSQCSILPQGARAIAKCSM